MIKTIAIDCDDVIVASAPAILDDYNQRFGTQIQLKDYYSNDLQLWAADSNETAVKRVEEFLMTPQYQQLPPFQDAIEVIGRLSNTYDLHIVTGRPDFMTTATKDMLQKHFPGLFSSVEFTNFFGKTPRSKADVCRQLGVDLLIDDHLHHATVVAECGVPVLLFGDYPWNQADVLPPLISRVKNWDDVARALL